MVSRRAELRTRARPRRAPSALALVLPTIAACGFVDGDPIVSGPGASGSSLSGGASSGTAGEVDPSQGSLDGTEGTASSSTSTAGPDACGCDSPGPDQRCMRLVNACEQSIQAGLTGDQTAGRLDVDVALAPGECMAVAVTEEVSGGRAFGRTGCVDDVCASDGNQGRGTLVQFTLSATGADLYDVSLVDGFNLPMVMSPVGMGSPPQTQGCQAASCAADLRVVCPEGLARFDEQGDIAYCTSACGACGDCPGCTNCGDLGNPACDACSALSDLCCTGLACEANEYSMLWKSLCPDAITYAGEGTAFSCDLRSDYDIVFCP